MSDSDTIDLSQRWLLSATEDFNVSQRLVSEPPFFLKSAIFHCQQCAEKSLKTILVLNGISDETQRFKTHSLRFLIGEASKLYPELTQFEESVEALNNMDTAYRYPNAGNRSEPTLTEFKNGFSIAKTLLQRAAQLVEAKVKAETDKQQTPEQLWQSLSKNFSSTGVKLSQQVTLKAFQYNLSEETVVQILAHDPTTIDLKQKEGGDRANQYIRTIISGAKFTLRQSPRPQQDTDLEL